MKFYCLLFALLILCSCQHSYDGKVLKLLKDWEGREIIFPDLDVMDVERKDAKFDYMIVTYVDSVGCFSCKLNLRDWMNMKQQVAVSDKKVGFLFFLQTQKTEELDYIMKWDDFDLPIVFDVQNLFYRLNLFPDNESFRTFLLDKDNKVLAIGNPIHNPKVKELYLKIIQGEKIGRGDENKMIRTKASIDKTSVLLGSFDWQKEQKATFILKNVGDKPLVVQDVTTSCGCTTVAYPKEPALPGREIVLEVVYKAEHPEHFNKTITVYCNAETSPLVLKISGDAKY